MGNRQQQAVDRGLVKAVAADAGARARAELRQARRLQQEDQEWEFRQLLLDQGRTMFKASLFRQRVNAETGQVALVPAKWSKEIAHKYVDLAMKLGHTSAQMPAAPVADQAGGLTDGLYDTSGQLDAELPDAAAPTMPADTHAKPELSPAVNGADAAARRPDVRNRERPCGN